MSLAQEIRTEMHQRRRGWLTAVCGLSASQFVHSFRRLMDLSFGSFRTRTRLAYAAQLLLSTDHSVERLAERLGFTDASHLHRSFARIYGCTPARYRREGQDLRGASGHWVVELSDPNDPSFSADEPQAAS